MPRNDRTIRALLLGAFVALCLAAGLLAWTHHRERMFDARYQAMQDSLTRVQAALHDTAVALGERYRVDTIKVRETTTVYRTAVARTETTFVTAHGDSVRADTLAPVKALVLACTNTIAARDTALSVCEQRLAVARRVFVADSMQQASTIAYLGHAVRVAARQGRATGRKQGIALTVLGFVAAGLAWRAIPH